MKRFPFSYQYDSMDCGPACLKMVSQYYGKTYPLEWLRGRCFLNRDGVSILSMAEAGAEIGFRTMAVRIDINRLVKDCPLPCILHWEQYHYVVLHKIKRHWLSGKKLAFDIADPSHGLITIDADTLTNAWITSTEGKGIALLLEPGSGFYARAGMPENNTGFLFMYRYLAPYFRYILLLLTGMVAASIISLAFPFLMQLIVDHGIKDQNIRLIYLLSLAQLSLFMGATAIDAIQRWLLLHVGARISLNIISEFLGKLLRLPVAYFDTKTIGDISQRINDHSRIEGFLTTSTLGTLFSIVNIFIFCLVLGFYSKTIVSVFLLFSMLAIVWILLFRKKRKQLDYKRFAGNKESQDKLYEMIVGMPEIKLYGSETNKRLEWERIQVKQFRLNIQSLSLEQYQKTGFLFLTQLKNIVITFLAAMEVINGHASIGILLSISYIIGQTNAPIEQLVAFIKTAQDAKLSINRMQEVHARQNEEDTVTTHQERNAGERLTPRSIRLNNVSFQYEGPNSPFVLKDVSLTIPAGKVTAIVGASGSGKTTLMKLLLAFYHPVAGSILVGKEDLKEISPKTWRRQCGTVLQDGYLFSDTLARNIALDGNEISPVQMQKAVNTANIKEFIEALPMKYTTRIGSSGAGLSGGQKQRLLIARAVYKEPSFIFFDEATSALDAHNERIIMENLASFFTHKTVVVIAHRLSTVKNADQIVVLKNGQISEIGDHASLTHRRGEYFHLVKNQLELGK